MASSVAEAALAAMTVRRDNLAFLLANLLRLHGKESDPTIAEIRRLLKENQ